LEVKCLGGRSPVPSLRRRRRTSALWFVSGHGLQPCRAGIINRGFSRCGIWRRLTDRPLQPSLRDLNLARGGSRQ